MRYCCILWNSAHAWRETIKVEKGDTVHHPDHGLGEVRSVRRRSFSGKNGSRFVEIWFEREELTVMLREADLAEVVREPIGPRRADRLLDHVRSWKGKPIKSWKTRANTHEKLLQTGDPRSYAEVYKRLKHRQVREEKLTIADRRHLEKAREFLAEELAVALGKSPHQADRRLAEAAGM